MKKRVFVLGWILIAIGFLGILSDNLEIPSDAHKLNNYAYVQEIGNGQMRLTVFPRPLAIPFFSIQAPLADRRIGIHYSYPDQYFDNTISAQSTTEGVAQIIGYCEFDLRTFNITSLTSAELYFEAWSNRATPNDNVGIYLCENITGNVCWNHPLARGDLLRQVAVTTGSPNSQEFDVDVTSATRSEILYDEVVTFGFYPESNNCMVQIVTNSSQIWPILTIDYTPESQTSGGGSSGGNTGNTSTNTNTSTYTGNSTTTYVDETVTEDEGLWKWWPFIAIIVGVIMVGWASNWRFFR